MATARPPIALLLAFLCRPLDYGRRDPADGELLVALHRFEEQPAFITGSDEALNRVRAAGERRDFHGEGTEQRGLVLRAALALLQRDASLDFSIEPDAPWEASFGGKRLARLEHDSAVFAVE